MTGWHNWAGNQVATPARVATPTSVDDIVAAVKSAASDGLTVRAAGAGHSFTAAAATDGVLLRLDRYADLLAVDTNTGLVTVQSGMRLHMLNKLLDDVGLAMPNLGDIDVQTVSGALSTGTHGTGATLTGLTGFVAGLELVLADGSVVNCSAEENSDLFAAARLGLGALGVTSTVTLQTVPAFTLRAVEAPLPLADVLDQFDELSAGNEHFEFYWFPYTTAALTKRNNRLAAGEATKPMGALKEWFDDELMTNTVFNLTNRACRRFPAIVPRVNRFAARALGAREFTDRSHKVFVSPRRVRFVEMEYAVPRAEIRRVLDGVRGVTEAEREAGRPISFPIEVRVAAADDVWLSTAYGRASAYVAVHAYVGTPYEDYFRGVEAVVNEVAGRPHWGKLHFQDAASLRPRYPRFDDFLAVRTRVDPEGRFRTDYLDRVFGTPSG